MKKILSLFAIVYSSLAFAGQITWSAYYFDASFVGGTAYLVQTTKVNDISQIKNAMSSSGLITDAKELADKGYTFYTGANPLEDKGITVTNPTESLHTSIGDTGNYFLVIMSADSSKYSVTGIETIALDSVLKVAEKTFGVDSSYAPIDGYYFNGTVGGGTTGGGDVPEPTVLALLALGVAGVALRRKVA